jgi:hypothetical protein
VTFDGQFLPQMAMTDAWDSDSKLGVVGFSLVSRVWNFDGRNCEKRKLKNDWKQDTIGLWEIMQIPRFALLVCLSSTTQSFITLQSRPLLSCGIEATCSDNRQLFSGIWFHKCLSHHRRTSIMYVCSQLAMVL